jgi:hyperosmotically inducible periplasmic protein
MEGILDKGKKVAVFAAACMLTVSGMVFASQEPDKTRTHQQDRAKGGGRADQQAENQVDRDLAKKVRKSITNDKSLSTYAHNIKVIARGGSVTLRGSVRSENEKTAIEAKAVEIAGTANVKNELSVN